MNVIPCCLSVCDKSKGEAGVNGKIKSWRKFLSKLQMIYLDRTIKWTVENDGIRGIH